MKSTIRLVIRGYLPLCVTCKCKKGSYGVRVCKFILTFSGVFVIALQIDFVTYTSSLSMTFFNI